FAAAGLHEELIHLPLLLRCPHAEHAGLRVNALTQSADLGPTLRELFGLPADGDRPLTGRSVAALARGDDRPLREVAISGMRQGDRKAWGVRSAEWYLMIDDAADRTRKLFAKPEDRWEVNEVSQHHEEVVEGMEKQLRTLQG